MALARSLLARVGRQWGTQKKYALFADYLWMSGKALSRAARTLDAGPPAGHLILRRPLQGDERRCARTIRTWARETLSRTLQVA